MDRQTQLRFEPETIPTPGETVVEYLEFHDWSQRDLARRSGLTPKTISEICSGKAPITPTTALAFEKVFRRPAHFWLNLQRQFDEMEARGRMTAKMDEWKDWAKKFPIAEMKHFGWFNTEPAKDSAVDSLLDFLGVSSPSSWENVWKASNVAFRQTRKFKTTVEAVSAWVRATEIMAADLESDTEVGEFDDSYLWSCLKELRYQTRTAPDHFKPNVQSICAKAGVLVVWVPELKNTGISGCARWLTDKKAVIALTLRYKTDDQMWFTFFHELGHVLLHRKEKNFILDNADEDLGDQVIDPPMRAREEEANRFAADTLIPPDALFKFILEDDFSNDAIHSFSEELGIGPGVVVGRLQREGIIARHQGNALKQVFHWEVKVDE